MEISIEHLNKNYGKQNVLKDISLHIPIGMYGMLGENGAGRQRLCVYWLHCQSRQREW